MEVFLAELYLVIPLDYVLKILADKLEICQYLSPLFTKQKSFHLLASNYHIDR
jgi:hypothetical protein